MCLFSPSCLLLVPDNHSLSLFWGVEGRWVTGIEFRASDLLGGALPLELLHQPFFVLGIFEIGLESDPDLSLPSH
jgi:hypothetical protein